MLKKLLAIGIIFAITGNAIAYDGTSIPCADGGNGNCTCDVDNCSFYGEWNNSLNTFMCRDGKNGDYTCSCIDVTYGTITFTCGCYSDSDCGYTGSGYGCINNRCQKCKSCTGASTGSWTAGNAGYESRIIKSCNCAGTLQTKTEYRCAAGYYGSTSNGTSGCSLCPEATTIYTNSARITKARGTSAAGTTSQNSCYLAAGTYYDSTGTFTVTGTSCTY